MCMAWLAAGYRGSEWIYSEKPERAIVYRTWRTQVWHNAVKLPKGSIKKLIGRELTWNDEPVELK